MDERQDARILGDYLLNLSVYLRVSSASLRVTAISENRHESPY